MVLEGHLDSPVFNCWSLGLRLRTINQTRAAVDPVSIKDTDIIFCSNKSELVAKQVVMVETKGS